jgi:hypothetical protein
MSRVEVEIVDGHAVFRPLDELRVRVRWSLDGGSTETLAVQLLWHTEGKGTRDADIVTTETIERPAMQGEREIAFRLPAGPYSFSGQLLSVVWKLQAVLEPSGDVTQTAFVVSPAGREIDLLGLDSADGSG